MPRLLEPLARVAPQPPGAAEHAAADVATAALIGDGIAAQEALSRLEAALATVDTGETDRSDATQHGDDVVVLSRARSANALLPLAIDLANAAESEDARTYRAQTRALLARDDLNPAHRARLEQAVEDDALALARRRMLESYESIWATTFNAISIPLGRSLLTGFATSPYEIAMSVTHYLAGWAERPAISLQERQALVHWQRFLERHPDAAEAPSVRRRIERARERLARTHRDHFVRSARLAAEHGQPRLAAAQAERALGHLPEDQTARELLAAAHDATEAHRQRRRTSVGWADDGEPLDDAAGRYAALARELLVAGPDDLIDSLSGALHALPEEHALHDELVYAMATLQIEQGYETAGWKRLDALARLDPTESNMARHAAALVANPEHNAYRSFRHRLVAGRERAVATEVLGPWSRGPRYQALPAEVAYLIDAPAIAQTALSTPFRLLLSPLQPQRNPTDYRRGAALSAYDYLERRPAGEHARELIGWLFEYERDRGNALAALRLADLTPEFDRDERLALAEKAAQQQFEMAARTGRRDLRSHMLRRVVREFPDSQAGAAAGLRAREEALDRTPQRIRLTRGFLQENPQLVAPQGLGLDPSLLDGERRNGELHPDGITFIGGRWIELALIDPSGDEDAPPATHQREIGAERLARTAALLDEAATLGVHLDADETQAVDGSRDLYLERARLGLTDDIDRRPTAESTYVYRGLRERFGALRGRESILPFDLVLQGSLRDLRLGAFPRWRQPERTPDAFLYR